VSSKKYFVLGILCLILICAVFYFLSAQEKPLRDLHPIVVAMEATPVNSLFYIAEENGFFEENGIAIIINDGYSSGFVATEAMLEGNVDIATAAELAVVRYTLENKNIRTIGNIDRFMHQYLITRNDRGIAAAQDLAGKKVGVPLQTGAQFNFSRYLTLHGVAENEVMVVDVQAPKVLEIFRNREVDAVVAWQPNTEKLKTEFKDSVSVWSIQNNQPMYCSVVATESWLVQHPG